MPFLLSKQKDRSAPCYSQLLKPSTHRTETLYQYFTVFFNAPVTLRTKFSPLIPLFICMEICYPHDEHRPRPRTEEIHYYTNLIVILLRQTSVIRIFLYQTGPHSEKMLAPVPPSSRSQCSAGVNVLPASLHNNYFFVAVHVAIGAAGVCCCYFLLVCSQKININIKLWPYLVSMTWISHKFYGQLFGKFVFSTAISFRLAFRIR